jgi:hypothetical protein
MIKAFTTDRMGSENQGIPALDLPMSTELDAWKGERMICGMII